MRTEGLEFIVVIARNRVARLLCFRVYTVRPPSWRLMNSQRGDGSYYYYYCRRRVPPTSAGYNKQINNNIIIMGGTSLVRPTRTRARFASFPIVVQRPTITSTIIGRNYKSSVPHFILGVLSRHNVVVNVREINATVTSHPVLLSPFTGRCVSSLFHP